MKWQFVDRVEELPPGARKLIEVDRREIGVFNIDNDYYAILNKCPHAGGPLCLGNVTGTTMACKKHYGLKWVGAGEILRCPWHAWEFYLSTGCAVGDPRIRAVTYKVIVEDGRIFIQV